MKLKITLTLALSIFAATFFSSQAQSGFVPLGGDISGEQGSLSFSIGDLSVQKSEIVSAGIQQMLIDQLNTVGVQLNSAFQFDLFVFPNPFVDQLTIRIEKPQREKLSYAIFDLLGNRIVAEQIKGAELSIATNNYPAGIYLLKILSENRIIKTIKIIKNK